MGKVYGYIRVSSTDQHEDRQLLAMTERGIPQSRLYMDKQSGKDFKRPEYRTLIKKLRPGDQLCITSIDRLGRNYEEIQEQWRILTREKKVDILVFDMPLLDTRRDKDLVGTLIADIFLQVILSWSRWSRKNIHYFLGLVHQAVWLFRNFFTASYLFLSPVRSWNMLEHGILFDHAHTALIGLPEAFFSRTSRFRPSGTARPFPEDSGNPVLFTRLDLEVFSQIPEGIRGGYNYHPLSRPTCGAPCAPLPPFPLPPLPPRPTRPPLPTSPYCFPIARALPPKARPSASASSFPGTRTAGSSSSFFRWSRTSTMASAQGCTASAPCRST